MFVIKKWVLAFRPKTLTAALVPVMVGTAISYLDGFSSWWITLAAISSATFIQIGTNLVNDAMDFKKGADTEERIGPQRITQSGESSYTQVMIMGGLAFVLAMIFGLPLVWVGGWPIIVIGVLSILCGYAYTSGPAPLAYKGLGDLFVIIFFGIVAVMGTHYLHSKTWNTDALIAGLQIGFLSTVLIAINNFRDMDGDKKVGKKTLPVRFGASFARYEILSLIIVSFLLGYYWWSIGLIYVAFLPLATMPLGLRLAREVFTHEPSPVFNQFLAQAALLHLSFGILMSIGFYLS